MNMVISVLNAKYIHSSLAPWCLAAGVREHSENSHKVHISEGTINGDITEFAKKISLENPDLICLCCYIWNIEKTLELCKILKANTTAKIVLGGPEVSYNPKEVLENNNFVDFIISGEGEFALPNFADTFCKNGDLNSVNGLSFRRDNNIISVPKGVHKGTPPSPYSKEYFKNLNGRICYIETSRGCPYSCAFCLSGRCSPLRFFDIDKSKENILLLANSGTKTVKFVDRTFNSSEKRANEIFGFIIENYGTKIPKGVCFHFEIAGDILKNSTMEILKSAPKGLFQLEIGMQSFNEDTLKAINRKTDTKVLIKNIKTLLSFNNMHIHIDLIAGLVGEDIKSFENSFNIGFNLKAHMLQMGFLKLLHGAKMREESDTYPCEFNKNPPYEVVSTPVLSKAEISALKNTEDALERLYNSGRFLSTIEFVLSETDYTPFKLFYDLGNAFSGEKMPLCTYAEKLYDFLSLKVNKNILRDKIVLDLICSTPSPKIPEKLKVQDKLYKKIKKHLMQTNQKVNLCILYSENSVAWVNPVWERDFRGRYTPKSEKTETFIVEE